MVVVVINESLDSAVERRPVFLMQDVNVLIFNCFPKSFVIHIIFSSATAAHKGLLYQGHNNREFLSYDAKLKILLLTNLILIAIFA